MNQPPSTSLRNLPVAMLAFCLVGLAATCFIEPWNAGQELLKLVIGLGIGWVVGRLEII